MIRILNHFLVLALVSAHLIIVGPVWAQEGGNKEEISFLYNFLSGPYILIGRSPDSDRTYSGKVLLQEQNGRFTVTRTIGGKTVKGTGRVETATGDRIKVLRMRFTQEGKNYEGTYLIASDLDNYGRLSGYLYLKQGNTTKPGLEALFIDHGPLEGN